MSRALRFISSLAVVVAVNDLLVTLHHAPETGLSVITRTRGKPGDKVAVRRPDGSRYVTRIVGGMGDALPNGNIVPYGYVAVQNGMVQRAMVVGKVVASIAV